MSFFDEVETTVANTRFLQATDDDAPIELDLKPISELAVEEAALRSTLDVKADILRTTSTCFWLFCKFLRTNGYQSHVAFLEMLQPYEKASRKKRVEMAQTAFETYLTPTWTPPVEKRKSVSFSERRGSMAPSGERRAESFGPYSEKTRVSLRPNEAVVESLLPGSVPDSKSKGGIVTEGETRRGSSMPDDTNNSVNSSTAHVAHLTLGQTLESNFAAVLEETRGVISTGSSRLWELLLECLATFYEPLKEEFKNSELFITEVQLRHYSSKEAKYADFRVFRVLGRGAFGAVSVVQKLDTHEVFAMKEMDKRRVKHERMTDMCVLEKKVLSKMRSPFVLGLDYALCNDTSLFLIFPLLSGGDLKFHLLHEEEKCFEDARAKFYVAETLLGLEHIHSFDIVYRDLKPANIILNQEGHVVVSDLGLCIQLRKDKLIKHLAGTAGYWAPEIVSKQGTYKVSDIWSLGVMMYEMLTGARPKSNANKNAKEWSPFGTSDANEKNALLPDSICVIALEYPPAFFTPEAKDLLEQIFNQDPLTRIGCSSLQQIKDHAWFAEYDWDALRALEIEPPYVPDNRTVHAESIGDVGQSDNAKYKKEKITPDDELIYKNWYYHNTRSVQRELVGALIKMDQPRTSKSQVPDGAGGCCTLL